MVVLVELNARRQLVPLESKQAESRCALSEYHREQPNRLGDTRYLGKGESFVGNTKRCSVADNLHRLGIHVQHQLDNQWFALLLYAVLRLARPVQVARVAPKQEEIGCSVIFGLHRQLDEAKAGAGLLLQPKLDFDGPAGEFLVANGQLVGARWVGSLAV